MKLTLGAVLGRLVAVFVLIVLLLFLLLLLAFIVYFILVSSGDVPIAVRVSNQWTLCQMGDGDKAPGAG